MADDLVLARAGEMEEAEFGLFARLSPQPADPLLGLIAAYRSDPRPDKIDLGVGIYRDAAGTTPVLSAVKAAEAHLLENQSTKAYLGPEGDLSFVARIADLLFAGAGLDARLSGIQTPGGTGALRLAAELAARARPDARLHIGTPSWPNHIPILAAAGVEIVPHRHFDVATQTLCFGDILAAIDSARAGDLILLHGCCHNPTGADFSADQWLALTDRIVQRGLVPLVDLAYHGLGDGLDQDALGLRTLAAAVPELLLAYSCDKNFGLYRERTGALFTLSATPAAAAVTLSNMLSLTRANWSMPPDHGAAIVRIILVTESLTELWRSELEAMRRRLTDMRTRLAALDPACAAVVGQKGLFSTLPLSGTQVGALRDRHGVYMTGTARINLAGLAAGNLPRFAAALAAVR